MKAIKKLIFFSLFTLGFAASFNNVEKFSFDIDRNIVGGEIANRNSHPYQVGIFITFPWTIAMCGGVLLSNRIVISAAHCTDGSSSTEVILGAHFLFTGESSQQRFIVTRENYIQHPQFNSRMLYNDIVLLVLPNAVEFTRAIQPINLPTTEMMKESFEGEIATVSGWGRFSDSSNSISDVLRYTQNEIKGNSECFVIFGDFVIDSTLCTITKNTQSGICNGDSGGPLTLEKNGQRYLVGVVSFVALAGCQLNYPTGYARVTSFYSWIKTNMNKFH
jgi:secreted trypsin-like serine protease